MSLLQIRGLTASYDRSPVLHDVSLEVPEGGFIAVVGANTAIRPAGDLPRGLHRSGAADSTSA